MTKNTIAMRRKWFLVPIGIVSITLLSGYALLAMSARHPLSLSKFPIFSSGLLPIAPSSILNKEKWSAAFGLASQTLSAPVSRDSLVVAGQRYDVPLPDSSFRNRDRTSRPYSTENGNGVGQRNTSALHTYITFATPEQLDAYYSKTLPEAGWEFSDRLGGARFYRKNTARLFVSDSFYRGTRISQLNLAIDDVNSTSR
jgi:hypothetical protein